MILKVMKLFARCLYVAMRRAFVAYDIVRSSERDVLSKDVCHVGTYDNSILYVKVSSV
jgi:hypothetical protein